MTDKEKTTKAMVVSETDNQIISNFDPQKQVEQAKIAAQALMSVINQKAKPVKFNGEQYLEFEDWQTIAQFYNHTVGIEKTEQIEEDGKIIGFVAKATLFHNGVTVGGAEAACMKDEPNWKSKPLFQLRSMAQTRAMAKALRSRFGFVAVLAGFKPTPAEEMQDVFDKKQQTPEAEYYCESHDLPLVMQPAGVSKQGKPYKAFWKCTEKVNDKFCKGPFTDTEGNRVKQNPETGNMDIVELSEDNQRIEEKQIVEESSIDKARRILNAKVPPLPIGDYPL